MKEFLEQVEGLLDDYLHPRKSVSQNLYWIFVDESPLLGYKTENAGVDK